MSWAKGQRWVVASWCWMLLCLSQDTLSLDSAASLGVSDGGTRALKYESHIYDPAAEEVARREAKAKNATLIPVSPECKNRLQLSSSWDYIAPEARLAVVSDVLKELHKEDDRYAADLRILSMVAFFFHVNHSSETRSIIACVAPKVASTNVQYLFQRYNLGPEPFLTQTMRSNRYFQNYKRSKAKFERPRLESLADPTVPRVIFVRNPYTRILSFYLMDPRLGYVCTLVYNSYCSHQYQLPTFAAFVDAMYERWYLSTGYMKQPRGTISKKFNYHLFPQNWFCAQPLGMQFNVVVKIEDLPRNYRCFVERLQLHDTIDTGWSFLNKLLNNVTDDCFFKPSMDLPCDWWHANKTGGSSSSSKGSAKAAALRRGLLQYVAGAKASGGVEGTVREDAPKVGDSGRYAQHSTGASKKVRAMYTEDARRKVAEMYQQDFIQYGYSFELP